MIDEESMWEERDVRCYVRRRVALHKAYPFAAGEIQSQLSTEHPRFPRRDGTADRSGPASPFLPPFLFRPDIRRHLSHAPLTVLEVHPFCHPMPISSRRPLPEQLDTPLDLAPLTEESLQALRNLASHVPHPSTEPCPESVPAFRRAAVLLGIFGSRKGCVYAIQWRLSSLEISRADIAVCLAIPRELYVVLSERSSKLRSHGGDTAIPGGRFEVTDADLEATAVSQWPTEPTAPRLYDRDALVQKADLFIATFFRPVAARGMGRGKSKWENDFGPRLTEPPSVFDLPGRSAHQLQKGAQIVRIATLSVGQRTRCHTDRRTAAGSNDQSEAPGHVWCK